jgi:hypothetical protein
MKGLNITKGTPLTQEKKKIKHFSLSVPSLGQGQNILLIIICIQINSQILNPFLQHAEHKGVPHIIPQRLLNWHKLQWDQLTSMDAKTHH